MTEISKFHLRELLGLGVPKVMEGMAFPFRHKPQQKGAVLVLGQVPELWLRPQLIQSKSLPRGSLICAHLSKSCKVTPVAGVKM